MALIAFFFYTEGEHSGSKNIRKDEGHKKRTKKLKLNFWPSFQFENKVEILSLKSKFREYS